MVRRVVENEGTLSTKMLDSVHSLNKFPFNLIPLLCIFIYTPLLLYFFTKCLLHATVLIAQKQPDKVVAERLGNTPQMIWDTYGHNYKALEKNQLMHFPKHYIYKSGGFLIHPV
ncbi:hypothetical protein J7E63_05630 [Bacillus sp. ISL-75]|nr:hypothetical protein [Bacillus sp. ISL-75]